MSEILFKIGITQGDINGIGYEVIMKALSDNKITEIFTPIVYGVSKVANFHKSKLDLPDFSFQVIKKIEQVNPKKSNLLNLVEQEVKIDPGESTETAGKMAEMALNMACRDLKGKLIDAVVTAPINKANIQSPNFKFTGHTEYFAQQFSAPNAMMMMVAENLRIGFVTNHLPLSQVAQNITSELIFQKLKMMKHTLQSDFACTNPKIAVLSLNPHAGDNGLIGSEDQNVIVPAVQRAFETQINAFGPFPADGFFGSGTYLKFDAVLAMYHEQGMIPFKLLSQGAGVNFTAGLPIVRTSPAHGTAYDITCQNLASCDSMRNALYLAVDILRNRKEYSLYNHNNSRNEIQK